VPCFQDLPTLTEFFKLGKLQAECLASPGPSWISLGISIFSVQD
jgi:hypothetical protein